MPTVTIGANTTDTYTGLFVGTLNADLPTNTSTGADTSSNPYNFGVVTTNRRNILVRPTGITNIPSTATVTAASLKLRLFESYGVNRTITLTRVLRNFVSGQVCWDNWSTGNAWDVGGAEGSATDVAASSSGDAATGTTNDAWFEANDAGIVTDVQAFVDGTYGAYGWRLTNPGGTAAFYGPTATDGYRPYLEVTYTEAGGSPVGIRRSLLGAG